MSRPISVTKRNGSKELLNIEKIHKVVDWAGEGLQNVSVSQVVMKAEIQFIDGMNTSDIHVTLIKSAADLISESTPDYQYLAARLNIFHLRKKAFGQFKPTALLAHISGLVSSGHYDKHILEDYSAELINELDDHINHDRDMNFAYSATKQFEGKYLVQNRVTGQVYESPQQAYMLIGMCLFSKYKGRDRVYRVKSFYDAVSSFKISLPTPIMAGVRTPTRQFSSCVLIEPEDSLRGISAGADATMQYIAQRAGIGLNLGRIRAVGSEVNGGEKIHTGCIPFFKHFQTAVKSCSQGGLRGGSATVFYPLWHYEAESLIVLKNNKGTEDNRVRHMDYAFQANRLMLERLIKGGNISLFSPHEVPGLYDAFFADQDLFEELYVAAENNPSVRRKTVKAIDLWGSCAMERSATGRIYVQFVDHTNDHGPFLADKAPIRQSNLCLEIALPTKPMQVANDPHAEIALCTLSAFNLGEIESLDELEGLADIVVRALDELLDYQDYPLLAAESSSMSRRTLGVGVTNFAYYLAKNNVKYSDGSANELVHETFEAIQYYLLQASAMLAREKGECPLFSETKYSKGILPIDTYKREVDDFCAPNYKKDWESLRRFIVANGLRNSTLTALMPCETSSQVSNSTNGIEPPRGLMSVKQSKDGLLRQMVPESSRLKSQYEFLWDMPDNNGYLELCAIMQKFVDQAISANTNYDPHKFPGNKVPVMSMIKDIVRCYQIGLKTLYYHNTRDHASRNQVEQEDAECASGACKL
mgnify:CR=1 FL=1